MPEHILTLFTALCIAVFAAVTLAGFAVMLYIKKGLVRGILSEKYGGGEGSAFIVRPGAGFRSASEHPSFFSKKRGIVCLTEHELIFVPILGKSVIKIPAEDVEKHIQCEDNPDSWNIYTRGRGIFTVSAGPGEEGSVQEKDC